MPILRDFYPKEVTWIFRALFLAETFEKVSFDHYNFRITRLSARKSEQMKLFGGIRICNTKIRLTILCLSGFELYSRWVPLKLSPSYLQEPDF